MGLFNFFFSDIANYFNPPTDDEALKRLSSHFFLTKTFAMKKFEEIFGDKSYPTSFLGSGEHIFSNSSIEGKLVMIDFDRLSFINETKIICDVLLISSEHGCNISEDSVISANKIFLQGKSSVRLDESIFSGAEVIRLYKNPDNMTPISEENMNYVSTILNYKSFCDYFISHSLLKPIGNSMPLTFSGSSNHTFSGDKIKNKAVSIDFNSINITEGTEIECEFLFLSFHDEFNISDDSCISAENVVVRGPFELEESYFPDANVIQIEEDFVSPGYHSLF